MAPTLRPYQRQAVDAVWEYIREHDGHPCVVLPPGAGKSLCIAQLVTDAVERWQGRVLVCAHVKELLEQIHGALRSLCTGIEVGLYSAGLGKRKIGACTVAGIQSIWRRAADLFGEAPPDVLIVDEAHLCPPDGEGMYRTLIDDLRVINPSLRVIGLTATPYRTSSGSIAGPGRLFDKVVYSANVLDLIRAGFLSPLKSIEGDNPLNTSALHVRGGEFVPAEVEGLTCDAGRVRAACEEILFRTVDRKSVLIFCSSIAHASMVGATLRELGAVCGEIVGETESDERAAMIAAFRAGSLKFLASVNVISIGFDAPNVDCVVMLRPTLSAGLYFQQIGRGLRKAPGKLDGCLVLDFAGNVNEHGPIDKIEASSRDPVDREPGETPYRTCSNCRAAGIAIGARTCPECGFVLIVDEVVKHEVKPIAAPITSDQRKPELLIVDEIAYSVHTKRGAPPDAPRSLRVDYMCGLRRVSEYVCFEHEGFAHSKAKIWWERRSNAPMPASSADAKRVASALPIPEKIEVEQDGEWDRVVRYVFAERGDAWEPAGPVPGSPEWNAANGLPDDGVPF